MSFCSQLSYYPFLLKNWVKTKYLAMRSSVFLGVRGTPLFGTDAFCACRAWGCWAVLTLLSHWSLLLRE